VTKEFRNNFFFIFALILLFTAGFFVQYSTSLKNNLDIFNKHILFFFLALPLFFGIVFLKLEEILKINFYFYFINIFILIAVLIIGKTAMGATRWLKIGGINLQPSEFMKISIILMLANYFKNAKIHLIYRLSYFFVPILIFLAPIVFILLQPNLGTSMIILLISCTMIFTLFMKNKILIWSFLLCFASIPFAWKFGLHDYQKQRVLTFLNPESDPKGAGYNIIQSKIAIGSGGFFGQGYLNGNQNKLNFLPEQHTDFVFTVFAEEFGFLITMFLIFLYLYVLFKITIYASSSPKIEGKLILVGCGALIFWHCFINIGMCMDLLPVVGVPLPFISYGRSFLLLNIVVVALIINIIKNFSIEKEKDLKSMDFY
jgi:rod shape determining protein RodA